MRRNAYDDAESVISSIKRDEQKNFRKIALKKFRVIWSSN